MVRAGLDNNSGMATDIFPYLFVYLLLLFSLEKEISRDGGNFGIMVLGSSAVLALAGYPAVS